MLKLHIPEKLGLGSASFPSQWAGLAAVIYAARAGGKLLHARTHRWCEVCTGQAQLRPKT